MKISSDRFALWFFLGMEILALLMGVVYLIRVMSHKLLHLPGQEHLSQLSSGLSFPSHTGAAGLYLFAPGGAEMFVIFFAVLLLFGGKKIPELMRGIGKGLKEFQDAKDSVRKSLEDGLKQEEKLKL